MGILRRRGKQTVAHQVKWLMAVWLLVMVIYAAGSLTVLGRIRTQLLRETDQMSQLYTNELDQRFLRISRNLFFTMQGKNRPDSEFWKYTNLLLEEGELPVYPINRLREILFPAVWDYGTEYQLFIYLETKNQFYTISLNSEGSYDIPEVLCDAVKKQISKLQNIPYQVKKKWNIMSCEGENYMCKIAQNDGVYLGCFVNVKSILEPFSSLTMGNNGYVRLADEEDRTVGIITSEGIQEPEDIGKINSRYSIQRELRQAPFHIQMRISGERLMSAMMGSVIIVSGSAVILIMIGVIVLLYLRKNLLQPLQEFTGNLEKYDEGEYAFNLNENNLLELEQIDDKFRHMIHQIRRLKITLYEQELEKQKVEMDFLKLQIRPHFYLNCLNFIYSMIDFGQYENARRMSRITADYLSYIFRNAGNMVPVSVETEHCQNYLKILLLRYPDSFDYYLEVHEEVKDAAIFPFLIQIFVENAAKHALTLEEKILISVTVYPEDREDGTYVNIFISDTGKGFPQETLKKLQRGESLSKYGHHVGISNCLKRFRYYFGEMAEINFDNSPLGGAVVDIHIPYQKVEKERTDETVTGR